MIRQSVMTSNKGAPLFLVVVIASVFVLTIFNFAKTPISAAVDQTYGAYQVEVPCCIDPHAFKFKYDYKYIPPVFDTLLFPKCPTDDSPAALCQAVAHTFGKTGTSMFAVDYPMEAAHAGQWVSSDSCAIAVTDNGHCYNVYPAVKDGLRYSSECKNPLVGDPTNLGELFEYSIYAAGSIFFGNDTAVYSSGIIGEDLKSDTDTEFTSTEVTNVGPFAGTGLFVGGTVATGTGAITLTTGGEAKAGADPSGRIVGGFTPVSPQEQLEAQAMISAQVCALSQNMRKLDPNVDVIVNNNSTRIEIPCDEVNGLCIAEMSEELFNSDLDLFINNTDNNPVKINVAGTTISTERSVELANAAANVVALNFFEAKTIQIDCPIPPPTLTLCQCLCPQKEKENLFLRKRKLTIADVAEAGFEYTDDADVKKKRITIDKNDLDRNALDRNYRILFDKDINNPLMPMSIRNST
eukprot:Selendium_serpulae@DN4902_c0_g1_i13.p1